MDTGRSFGRPQTRRSAELSSRHPSDSPISYSRQHSGSNTRSIYSGDESEAEQPGRQRSSRFDVSDDRTKSTNEPSHRGYPTHRREHRGDGYHEDTPFIPSTSVREDPSRRATTYGGRAAERGRYSGFRGRSPPRLRADQRAINRGHSVPLAHNTETYESDGSSVSQESENSRMSQGSGPPSATGEINERNQDRNQRSGTIPPYRDDRRIVQDEPFPAQAPTPEQPPYRYNRERYPAYDANAHRIGLDHIRYDGVPNPPEQTGTRSYYRPRTRKYPTGSMDNVPHIMSINLNSPVLPSSSQLPSYGSSLPQASNATPNVGGQHRDSPSLDEQETDSAPKTRRPGVRAPPLTDYASTDVIPDATEHVRKALGLGPNQEVSLASLDDPPPGQKPQYSYPALIQLAILGSPRKRLTLSEIYTSIEARFEYYKLSQDNAWQSSIRHTLSLKSCFRSVNKPITEPGKGNYWVVDYSFGDGNKRVRKRNARPTKAEREQRNKLAAIAARREEEEESTDEEMDVDVPQPSRTPEPTSRVQIDDSNIDPELRNQGHIVGERRVRTSAGPSTRSDGRRANSPYAPSPPSSQSRPTSSIPRSSRPSVPRSTSASTTSPTTGPGTSSSPVKADYGPKIYTQSTLKLSARAIRQGSFARPTLSQATFGKPSLPAPSQAPNTRSPSTWAQYGSSAPVPYTGPATSATRDQSRASPRSPPPRRTTSSASDQAQDIRNAAIRRPTPRPGIEVVADPQGLVSARRVVTNASASQNSRPPAWSSNAPRSSRARESYSSRSGSSESESQD